MTLLVLCEERRPIKVICALQALIEELNRMIQADLNAPILLSYDTTFCLGDF